MNGYQQTRPTPMAQHPDEAWVDPLFKLIIAGVIAVLAAVLMPIMIVALVVFVATKLLRVPWWIFFLFFLVLFFIFVSLDMSPVESLEKVFRKLMRTLNGGHSVEFDFLLRKLSNWWRLQFPEVVSLGGMLGAILKVSCHFRLLHGTRKRSGRRNALSTRLVVMQADRFDTRRSS